MFLFKITNAAMTPGTHPAHVRRSTMSTDPQPQSITARGGKMMASNTRKNDMVICYLTVVLSISIICKSAGSHCTLSNSSPDSQREDSCSFSVSEPLSMWHQ